MDITGTLRVNGELDYESKQQYRLKIRAVDVETGDYADAIVVINIQVGDATDNLP